MDLHQKQKMVQQRQRRFKKFYELKVKKQIQEELRKVFEDEKEVWDTNAITPGTLFMDKLSSLLKTKLKSNPKFKNLKIILSDSNVPGEGEHKLLKHLKENRAFRKPKNKCNLWFRRRFNYVMYCFKTR